MKKKFSHLGLVAAFAVLAGCTGGTTYGTGTSHEEDTMKSLVNLLSISPDEKTNIDYAARPDLVMPANKQALPAPVEARANVEENWPVSPEQRIAAVRAGAPEVDRAGNLPTEYLVSEKDGLTVASADASRLRESRNSQDGTAAILEEIRQEGSGNGPSAEARKRREQFAYSTGVKRKFLTEPPTEYRTPSVNAEAGDLGISDEEIEAAQEKAKQDRFNSEKGVLSPTE